MVCKESKIQ